MTQHHKSNRILTAVSAAGLVALLAACKPVVGNKLDTTPPKLSFSVAGNSVPNNGAYDVFGTGYQVVITATDNGGVDSIETSIENVFTCNAGGTAAPESDSNPMSMKGYDYSTADHVYYAHRTAPDAFWPDTNGNGINNVSEHKLRYNQLIVADDASLVQQSFDALKDGSDCIMPDGVTHGTTSGDHLVIHATATNVRSEVAGAPASQSTATAFIELD